MMADTIPRLATTNWWETDPRPTLSPSALSAYEICGRRGQYYQDPTIPRSSSMATAVGSAWHSALEFPNRYRAEHGVSPHDVMTLEELLDMMLAAAVVTLNQVITSPGFRLREGESYPKAMTELETMLRTWGQAGDATKWTEPGIDVVAIEEDIFVDFGSEHHIFRGVLDKVLSVAPDGAHVGVDYKSANRAYSGAKAKGDPRHLPQAPLYAEAWELWTGHPIDFFAYDVTTKGGKFDRIWVPTFEAARRPFIDRWLEMSESIALHAREGKPMPTNPSHFLCSEKWCDYYTDYCPMGSAIDVIITPRQQEIAQ